MNTLKQNLFNIFSVILGLVLLSSAFFKLIDILEFENLLSSYGSTYFSYLAPFIILIEFYLGLHLLFLLNLKKIAFYTFLTLVLFTIIYTYGYAIKGIESCGCFGGLWSNIFDIPLVFYSKNILLISLSFVVYKKSVTIVSSEDKLKRTIIYLLLAVAIYQSGFRFIPMHKHLPEMEHNLLIDKFVSDLGLDEIYSFSTDSTYIVFLFSYSCPHCINSIANINLYKDQNKVSEIIFIPYGNKVDRTEFDKNFNLKGYRLEDNLDSFSSIITGYPTTLFIKKNNVIFVKKGLMPSPMDFYRKNTLK